MALELAKRGIRVNAVSPGSTRTGMIPDEVLEKYPDVMASLFEKTAFRRLGESRDIAGVIAALLSDDCRWVTAQNIEASGGFRLLWPTGVVFALHEFSASTASKLHTGTGRRRRQLVPSRGEETRVRFAVSWIWGTVAGYAGGLGFESCRLRRFDASARLLR
jgi:hypothetical protein